MPICIDQSALSCRAVFSIHIHFLSVSLNKFLYGTVMDSGARRLVVDVTDESDDGIVAYAFLRREFAFVGIADEVLGNNMLYPSGPFVVCRVHCLREFIEQFPYLSKRELRLVAAAHGIKFRSRITIMMCKDALRRHECRPDCADIVYKFCTLKRRRDVNFVPPDLDPPTDPIDDVEVVRGAEKQRKRVQRRKAQDAKRLVDQVGVESCDSLEYPPFRSFHDKTDIIREWQVAMNPENLTRGVCAVCAQVFEVKSLHEVTPSEEMLIVLHNERLPEQTLPSTYDFELYHRAILHPRGMTSLDSLASLRLCCKCRGAQVKKTTLGTTFLRFPRSF